MAASSFCCFYNSSSFTNLPKLMCLFSLQTKRLSMSINACVSVRSLCSCKIAKALNLCCVMFNLSQVLRRRAIEKDRSPEALVAWLTCSKLQLVTTSEIRRCSYVGRSFNFSKNLQSRQYRGGFREILLATRKAASVKLECQYRHCSSL